jgi:hypothetical protein
VVEKTKNQGRWEGASPESPLSFRCNSIDTKKRREKRMGVGWGMMKGEKDAFAATEVVTDVTTSTQYKTH